MSKKSVNYAENTSKIETIKIELADLIKKLDKNEKLKHLFDENMTLSNVSCREKNINKP